MDSPNVSFGRFVLDAPNRLLLADGVPVELSGRYLDALVLMVGEPGTLISKERFMDEVWRGVPVTDEALTQCVKTLRRVLGDDAARPRFIETVPKHGYRFVAVVEVEESGSPAQLMPHNPSPTPPLEPKAGPSVNGRGLMEVLQLTGAGIVGGGLAGLLGGIFYGFIGAAQPLQPGLGGGAGSIVLVMTALGVLIGLAGAAGVSLGIAAASVRGASWRGHVAGGALGGLVVGGIVKLLGIDAFNLLLGQSPGNVTGAFEGAALGGAVGLGVWLCGKSRLWPAALSGAAAGAGITAFGGRLMGGSLELLAQIFPQSRLRLDPIGALFGEDGFGQISHIATGAIEGGLFAASIAGAMLLARQQLAETPGRGVLP